MRNPLTPLGYVALFALTGCGVARVGAQATSIPQDAAQTCSNQCRQVGMKLSAMAIMAETVGCICEPTGAPDTPRREGAAVSGGMTTVLLAEAEASSRRASENAARRR
jgi:hypothetical protein